MRSAEQQGSFCVVAVVPHRRWGGHVAVTAAGVVPGSFCTWNLRDQADQPATIRRWLAASIARHKPAVVVIGRLRDDSGQRGLLDAAAEAARALGGQVVEKRVDAARLAILGGQRRRKGETLAAAITSRFLPELAADLESGIEHFRYRRHAWNAAALALVERGASREPCGGPPENLPVASAV